MFQAVALSEPEIFAERTEQDVERIINELRKYAVRTGAPGPVGSGSAPEAKGEHETGGREEAKGTEFLLLERFIGVVREHNSETSVVEYRVGDDRVEQVYLSRQLNSAVPLAVGDCVTVIVKVIKGDVGAQALQLNTAITPEATSGPDPGYDDLLPREF